VGRFTVPAQVVKYLPAGLLPSPSPSPSAAPLPESGFMGVLQKASNGHFYLVPSASAQAVYLSLPAAMSTTSLTASWGNGCLFLASLMRRRIR